ncbi:unnamed protein product [Zymoseptoria tritici ST99CH_3D7]|uniref:Uncharacterized protein n=1 Tax=Zymoseptoria tritici (strain ST99CH_3D7) TaxID=1276538 RepID=A0A1X7RUY8_ZYMT9|nr:unnamed protein product [Zymoseptoria tritici ST99CH_3D7]
MPPISFKPSKLTQPQPPTKYTLISYPSPGVLLVTINRPKELNCLHTAANHELEAIWSWLDVEPSLSVGILTGTGRAFCAGADLKEWNAANKSSTPRTMPPSGFGALSRRSGKKPILAAVNGICYGGGCEMIINADMVIASSRATFALPEVKIGVVAAAGALPRLIRTVGKPRAMEMALTGRPVGAREAERWGLVNCVVEDGEEKGSRQGEGVVAKAVELAGLIAGNSPDAVRVSREGVMLGWEGIGVEEGTERVLEQWMPKLSKGENLKEGVRAFVEKRKPKWVASKL